MTKTILTVAFLIVAGVLFLLSIVMTPKLSLIGAGLFFGALAELINKLPTN
jgi:hypothetical protein